MQSFLLYSGLKGLYDLLNTKKIGFAVLIYLLISAIIVYRYGINTNGEASKYIEDATRILHSEKLRNGFFSIFYLTYSLLVSFFIYFTFNLQGVACLQILFSLIAACCIYKLVFHITNDSKISFAAFVIYLVCYPLQKWNFFLYTESLHTSLTVIGLYYFYSIIQKNQTQRWWIFAILLLLIIFSRPVGVIFLLAAFITWLIRLIQSKRKFIYYTAGIVFITICFFLLQSQFIFYFNPDSLRRMEIICQAPESNIALDYKEYNGAGLSSFFHVIFSEIGIKTFLSNGLKKVGSFFSMTRDFYSTGHNIILLCTGIILYPFAIAGIFFNNKKVFYLKIFSLTYSFITSAGIFLTCDEWSNRFIAPLFPQIILLAALGLYWVKTNWFLVKKKITVT